MPTCLFVNQLSVIDSALLHPVRGLVGASWIVDVTLKGELDAQGMLFDFGPAKREIKRVIDAHVDHKLILAEKDPRLQRSADALEFRSDNGALLHLRSPQQAFCELPGEAADAAALARHLETRVFAAMPPNVSNVTIDLREEAIDGAAYAYCHGLKQHNGNCQRIAHGHRSRIEIYADGKRSSAHEQQWAKAWQDVYLGNRDDLLSAADAPRLRFGYDAEQGHFEIELDAANCHLLDAESTVENIAAHIATVLKHREPTTHFRVRAFEGVGKGAVSEA